MPCPQSSPLLHMKQTNQFSHFETTHWFWTNFKVLFIIIIIITGIPESVIMGQVTHILTRNVIVYILPKTPTAFSPETQFVGFTTAW